MLKWLKKLYINWKYKDKPELFWLERGTGWSGPDA